MSEQTHKHEEEHGKRPLEETLREILDAQIPKKDISYVGDNTEREPDYQAILEDALPLAVNLVKKLHTYFDVEQKATEKAVEFSQAGIWPEARSAVVVSAFFQRQRKTIVDCLSTIGANPYNTEPFEITKAQDIVSKLRDNPHFFVNIPAEKEDEEEEDFYDLLRRYGEF